MIKNTMHYLKKHENLTRSPFSWSLTLVQGLQRTETKHMYPLTIFTCRNNSESVFFEFFLLKTIKCC